MSKFMYRGKTYEVDADQPAYRVLDAVADYVFDALRDEDIDDDEVAAAMEHAWETAAVIAHRLLTGETGVRA